MHPVSHPRSRWRHAFGGWGGIPTHFLVGVVLAVSTLVTTVFVWSSGAHPAIQNGHDTMTLLDGGWRILQGQVPHRDFYSPLGPLMLQIVALGFFINGLHVHSINVGVLCCYVILTALAWHVSHRRLRPLSALLFCLFIGHLVLAKYALGDDFRDTSYAMMYNRIGWAITGVMFLLAFSPEKTKHTASDAWLAGVLMGLLLFLKVNYFAAALLLIPLCAPAYRADGIVAIVRQLVALTFGILSVCIPFLFYLHSFLPMLHDLQMATAARSSVLSPQRVADVLAGSRGELGLFALACAVCAAAGVDVLYTAALIVAAVVGGVFLVATNTQMSEIPILPVAALILCDNAVGRSGQRWATAASRMVYVSICAALVLVLAGRTIVLSGLSMYTARVWPRAHPAEARARVIRTPPLDDAVFFAGCSQLPTELHSAAYAARIDEGLSLIAARSRPDETVMALDLTNPFSYGLRRRSPRGDALWWHAGVTFTAENHPDGEEVFDDVDLVAIPTMGEHAGTTWALEKIYAEVLSRDFTPLAASPNWRLLRRRVSH